MPTALFDIMVTTRLLVFVALPVLGTACDSSGGKASAKTEKQYSQYCAQCHDVGAANAPRKGDTQSWAKRLEKGHANLVKSLKEGKVAMPPKGGCAECSDQELEALVEYITH